MACGTGKTFTSLRIAENITDGNGFVLFLIPSIALLGQILNEWYADAIEPIHTICICSDPDFSRKHSKNEDFDAMTDVFSTYQSIDVISKAQKILAKQLPQYAQFDLIICDEAHRTTGVTLSGVDESSFVKVHRQSQQPSKAKIQYYDIGDYYSRDEKLSIVKKNRSLANMQWQTLSPNKHGDWLNQRNDTFSSFIPLVPEKKFDTKAKSFFLVTSNGVSTARDNWVYNFSKNNLIDNITNSIHFYNLQVGKYLNEKQVNPDVKIEEIINWD